GWSATERTATSNFKFEPELQVVGSKIYYVWRGLTGISFEIWTAEMNIDGTGFSATQRTTGSNDKWEPQLQVVGIKIYYIWRAPDGSNQQIWTAEMNSNILNKGDFYGLGIAGNTIRGFINAGVDGFKYKAEAISYTAGASVQSDISVNWNHIATTYDRSKLKLYVNGVLVDSSTFTETINTNPFNLKIGDDFSGTIDEVCIFNTVCTAGWILTEYNNQNSPGTFYSVSSETPLPVELTSFIAYVVGNSVKLKWQTATEVNNYGFEIERNCSKDKEMWETIGFVEGHGNSNSPKSYSFTDKNPIGGSKFKYRLKQIDTDGKFEYSKVIEVDLGSPMNYELSQNYPNPFNPTTIIKCEIPELSFVTIKVYDVLGNEIATLVNEEKPAGEYEVEFNSNSDGGRNLPSGVYFYQLRIGGPETSSGQRFIQTKKMVLLK
ncbi:MAG: hypothetical protein A2W30_04910, partial [Ignavibacteria bacterium RBG_16_36_9]